MLERFFVKNHEVVFDDHRILNRHCFFHLLGAGLEYADPVFIQRYDDGKQRVSVGYLSALGCDGWLYWCVADVFGQVQIAAYFDHDLQRI